MSGRQYFSCLIYVGFGLCAAILLASCDSSDPVVSAANSGSAANTGSGVNLGSNHSDPLDIAQALGGDLSLILTVDLSGSMVLPAVATRESARADVLFDRTAKRMFAVLQSSLEQPLAVHIHEGGVGEVGAEVAVLYAQGAAYTLGEGVILTPRQAELLETGNLYIDVHTAAYPHGLLRAQLTTSPEQAAVYPLLEDIQAKVFTPVCSGCHNGSGQSLPGVLNFANLENSHDSLVGVFSISEPSVLRVEPGNPQDSLLLRKIEGTHNVGSRMPFRGSKLNEQTIAAIRGWIAEGALR